MALFKSQMSETLEAATARLAEAKQTLAAVEGELNDRSLDYALGKIDEPAVVALQDRVRRARDTVSMLETAVAEAERREAQRLAQARAAADRTRLNAIQGHIRNAVKAATKYREAIGAQAAAWSDFMDALRRAHKLVRSSERELFDLTQAVRLYTRLSALELARIGAVPPGNDHTVTPLPGAHWDGHSDLVPHGRNPREALPFDETVRLRLQGAFDVATGTAPAPSAPAQEAIEPAEAANG
jgi:hypothetical protein